MGQRARALELLGLSGQQLGQLARSGGVGKGSAARRTLDSALRQTRIKHHPDRHPDPVGKRLAEQRFKAATDAHAWLVANPHGGASPHAAWASAAAASAQARGGGGSWKDQDDIFTADGDRGRHQQRGGHYGGQGQSQGAGGGPAGFRLLSGPGLLAAVLLVPCLLLIALSLQTPAPDRPTAPRWTPGPPPGPPSTGRRRNKYNWRRGGRARGAPPDGEPPYTGG